MAAATTGIGTEGRIAVFGDLAGIIVTITASSTTYATATGGLPFDLTGVLNDLAGGAPFSQPYINPADVIGCFALQATATGKYWATALVVNPANATYTNPAGWPFAGGTAGSIQPSQQLLTCPATIRLYNGTTEFADGACSEVITIMLLIARGGTNA